MPFTSAEMRDLFPIARRYAYLDHAAIAPLCIPVRSAMMVFLDRQSEEPFELDHWERLRAQVRSRLGELVSAVPERITFVKNTTSGLGLVAAGLDWREGDNIVGVDREFPANIYPWLGLKSRGVELRLQPVSGGRVDLKALVELCDARTRMVTISAVQFWSGFRTDLAELAARLRGRDVLLCVDAMQAVGGLQFELSKLAVDFLCAGAQKWLLGPIGIGFAYVSTRMQERMRPVTIGTDSVVRDSEYFDYELRFKPDARRYEEAAANYPGILGLGAAVKLLLRAGKEQVESTILRLADRLREELPRRGYTLVFSPEAGERSGIVSFRHPSLVPTEVQRRLREAGIVIALRGDFLRASPHFYNSEDDISRLIEALPL
ncbi:MAG TPA: aminotransferase class V-fold PLP-dependent enzyme [Candidatus Dormibacteraeota bacterium]